MIVIMVDKLFFFALQAEVGRVRSSGQGQNLFIREELSFGYLLCHCAG